MTPNKMEKLRSAYTLRLGVSSLMWFEPINGRPTAAATACLRIL